jgi:Cdc6-like AAA superfamily ATPase
MSFVKQIRKKLMKYKILIEKTFDKYKLKPRSGQIETINTVLIQFVDEKKHNVVLSGSTGSGKSIIAVITTECLYELLDSKDKKNYVNTLSYILMHTNTLVKQY